MHFKYIICSNRPKAKREVVFYNFSYGLQSIEGSSERAGKWSEMILFSFSDQTVYLLSKYNKLTFECQTMKQVAWYFVGMGKEINNEGKKISASINQSISASVV